MKFSLFNSAKSQRGEECTHRRFLEVTNTPQILELCQRIAAETDANKRGELKKGLPVVTWQAYFPGRRVAKEAEPSGLFMLDIDHVEDPYELFKTRVAGHTKELGIVFAGKTASCHGLRIVAKTRGSLPTLADNQRWLAANLKVEYDGVCKDWARCSFLVHDSYTYFMDGKSLWGKPDPAEVLVNDLAPKQNIYENPSLEEDYDHMAEILGLTPGEEAQEEYTEMGEKIEGRAPFVENAAMEEMLNEAVQNNPDTAPNAEGVEASKAGESESIKDQREGLFGGKTEYKGLQLSDIAKEWLVYTGGEPEEGERNNRLYGCALSLRYICDFNEATLLRVLPRYGLPEEEMKSLIHSACTAKFGQHMPKDLESVLERMQKRVVLQGDDDDIDVVVKGKTDELPPLPPVFRQWAEIAPPDFKAPCVLTNLPILGALGSRLRAEYLDGKMQSPSFQVSLEAPQASGKSFVAMMINQELKQMMESDEASREEERAYNDKVAEMKMLNIKINADNKDQILGNKPKSIIRYVPPTMSITKMLMRMENAQGLHLFAYAAEIDTVRKAFARGFSSLSDMLRVSFDNELYGQDYASENSFSGIIQLFYNCVYTGTPKAMRKFYPDVEDGLVSRVLFVTLADQFGKPMPVWGTFDKDQQRIVDLGLTRLNEVTLQGSEVQPEHVMKMKWLNKHMQKWITEQQIEAVNQDDRTRDIFCRRAAVVGFRAGMIAWFLYEEVNTPTIRRNVCKFAEWVANNMLNQHILRFNVTSTGSNTNRYEDLYSELKAEFTRDELERAMRRHDYETPIKNVIYKWKLAGLIEEVGQGPSRLGGRRQGVKFKKIQ